MTYQPDVPRSGQSLDGTRDTIRTNFQQIDIVNSVNHVAFNNADKGKHKFLQMPEQSSAPATAINEAALYTKQGPLGTTQLYFRNENSGDEEQITGGLKSANGYAYLSPGILMQWGTNTAPSGNGGPFSFPVAFSTAPYSLVVTIIRSSSSSSDYDLVLKATPTANDFTTNSGFSNSHSFYWIAIGPV